MPEPAAAVPQKDEATQKAELIEELQKRKARAERWGMPTDEIEGKLKRLERFGLEAASLTSMTQLEGGLQGGKHGRKEAKAGAGTNGAAKTKDAPVKEPETVRGH